MYISLQRCRKMSFLADDVHVLARGERVTLLGGRLYVLRALPIADKCLAQFILFSLILGINATRHTECFADIVHGTVKSELTGKLR